MAGGQFPHNPHGLVDPGTVRAGLYVEASTDSCSIIIESGPTSWVDTAIGYRDPCAGPGGRMRLLRGGVVGELV